MENNNKNKDFDELEDIGSITEKYNHYALDDLDAPEVEDSFEDISSYSEGKGDFYSLSQIEESEENEEVDENEKNNKSRAVDDGNFFTRNRYHNTKIIALVLVIVILLSAGGLLAWLVYSTKSNGYGDNGIDFIDKRGDNYLVNDDHSFETMGDIDANSLNKYLYEWANNGGEKMYSKNIINVLLCGVDSVYDLCDAQILISVNKKTEQIKMISFLRDSWTYIKMPRSDGTFYDYYEKSNAAYHGGPATLKETIENNYKIEIDQYIMVDFKSFPKLIDALGGVEVEVQQYESDYIRRTSSHKNFPSGKARLNGKQALIFSRIRHSDLDNDLSRTRRQRSVIKGLISSAKTATKGQLVNAFKQVKDYLRTGYTQSEVISLIAQAVSHDWMNFEIKEITMPNEDNVERFGGYINSSTWAWTVDYPVCAQKIQKEIYGQTNIVLRDDRVSALDFVKNRNSYSGGESNSGESYYTGNENEGNGYQSGEYSSTSEYEPNEPNENENPVTGSEGGNFEQPTEGEESGGSEGEQQEENGGEASPIEKIREAIQNRDND